MKTLNYLTVLRFKNNLILLLSSVLISFSCGDDSPVLSSEASITSFTLAGVSGSISGTNITLTVPYGTDISNLSPRIQNSPASVVTPAAGTTRDFNSPVTYTVRAEDEVATTTYTVTVSIADPDSVVISDVSIEGVQSVDIDQASKTITIRIFPGTDISGLTATIKTIPADAKITPAGSLTLDLNSTVSIQVSAGSLSENYTIEVNEIQVGIDPDTAEVLLDAGVASSSLPSELSDVGDNERGFSINSQHVYVADKGDTKIWYWNLDGSSTEASELKISDVVAGGASGIVVADVVATDNGILASNLAIGSEFKIYRWADNDADPELIITHPGEYDGSQARYGDAITFIGEPNGDGHLYAMNKNHTNVLRWDFEGGKVTNHDNPEVIVFADSLDPGNYPTVEHIKHNDKEYLLVNGANIGPHLYSTDGTEKLASISTDLILLRALTGKVFEFNQRTYLALAAPGTEGSLVRDAAIWIYDVSGDDLVDGFNSVTAAGEDEAAARVYEKGFGQEPNGNQAADVDVYLKPDGESVIVMAGATNNGFIVVELFKSE